MYKANFCLRTAIRILKPIKNFTAKDADEVYNEIQAIPWEEYLDDKQDICNRCSSIQRRIPPFEVCFVQGERCNRGLFP